ncbi:MAG: hypothetical protein GXY83_30965 [Rhodopirellula sp.]|nr:hypothetical protein [Rhodopirellula sp.]
MRQPGWIVALFGFAALYDGVLGLLFLAAPAYPYEFFEVTLPNHLGYVQFPAAMLLIFTLMFVAVAWDPRGNRRLIPYGILLKVAYCGVAGGYWAAGSLPGMWKPFAVIDFIMGVFFAWAWIALGRAESE